jgi:hypothetical protein
VSHGPERLEQIIRDFGMFYSLRLDEIDFLIQEIRRLQRVLDQAEAFLKQARD